MEPDKLSNDYLAMSAYWQMIADITAGTDAIRLGGEKYLPRFESETLAKYTARLATSKFTNIYLDIVENLSDRPFAEEVSLVESTPTVDKLIENIDGQGNNLHNFSSTIFRNAIDYGVDWVFVDYTRTQPTTIDASGKARRKSILEERQSGARPYWVRVSAQEMIAVYSAIVNGVEEFVHCRMKEVYTERVGYDEVEVTQIRELNREILYDEFGNIQGLGDATYILWRENFEKAGNNKSVRSWQMADSGVVQIGIIPIVPVVIGERLGNSWRLIPSLKSVAYLQLEYYEQENGLKNVKKLTAFPMLTATGVQPEIDPATKAPMSVPVGPHAVLYGGYSEGGPGTWAFIEPNAQTMVFLKDDLKELAKEMRELGRQPLTQSSSQITVTTSVSAASKGNAAIQRWALTLKDALETAFLYTAMWLNETVEATVNVSTDFDLGVKKDDGFDNVLAMRKNGDLSQKTTWAEARRRNILSDEFDSDLELTNLDEEDTVMEDEVDTSTLPSGVGDLSPTDDPGA